MELLEFEFLEISPEGRGLAVWGIYFPQLCRQSLGWDRVVMMPSGCRYETDLITQSLTHVSVPVQAILKTPKPVAFPGTATWLLPLFKSYQFPPWPVSVLAGPGLGEPVHSPGLPHFACGV